MGGWECDTQKHNPVRHMSSGDRQTDLGQDLALVVYGCFPSGSGP